LSGRLKQWDFPVDTSLFAYQDGWRKRGRFFGIADFQIQQQRKEVAHVSDLWNE
jgi:hypothetical protein